MAYLKKFIVEQNGYLIDFGIINKFTSKPLDEQWYLFNDIFHPKILYGHFIYNALFGAKSENNDLYRILTKDNVDKELKKQKQELENWYKNNKDEYKNFLNINSEPKSITRPTKSAPEEYKEIILNGKIKNCH